MPPFRIPEAGTMSVGTFRTYRRSAAPDDTVHGSCAFTYAPRFCPCSCPCPRCETLRVGLYALSRWRSGSSEYCPLCLTVRIHAHSDQVIQLDRPTLGRAVP